MADRKDDRELTRLEKTNQVVETLREAITHAQEDELTGVMLVLNSHTHACIAYSGSPSELIGDSFIQLIKLITQLSGAPRKRGGGLEELLGALLGKRATVMSAQDFLREMGEGVEDDSDSDPKKGGKSNVN